MAIFRFLLLLSVKAASRVFYAFTVEWVGHRPPEGGFKDARIGLLMNHTSLFEPILLAILPVGWLWRVARSGLLPGADSTLGRPIVGTFFKWLVPDAVSITRNRDRTWTDFLSRIKDDSIVVMAPEGRMKRTTGLDKHGRPMTVRGGIADVLERVHGGTMVILYSGGLHHVHAPGERWPRFFRRVYARYEAITIEPYKREMGIGTEAFRGNVIADLERRRDLHCWWN